MATARRKVKDYSGNGLDLSRLTQAMRVSRKVLQRFREERTDMVRSLVGAHYSENGTREKRPMNLISNYVSVVGKRLIAKEPRVMLSTMRQEHKPTVAAMQDWVNGQIEEIEFANTEQRIIHDALFSVGIGKVCLATPADSARVGWNVDAGQPTAMRVDLDDFVFDVHARDFTEVGYIGHRYRVPLDVVKDSKIYGSNRKKLQPSRDNPYNAQGDERVSMIGRTYYASNDEEYEDFIELYEIFLPRHRRVITLPADDMGEGDYLWDEPLLDQPWIGPYCGPYHILGLGTVPGNAMPLAPLMNLRDLDDATNRLWRKLIRQSERQKSITVVANGATEDGDRLRDANDGDIIRSDNPDKLKELMGGGPNQANFQLVEELQKKFSAFAGNLDLLAGTGPQSRTATQDKLLNENASSAITDMQMSVFKHTSDMLKAMCWYWHHDPRNTMESPFTVPGVNVSVNRMVTPQDRQAIRFEDLKIKVDPYSLAYRTPESRLQGINAVVQQTIIPMMPILQQNGIGFDPNAYLTTVAELMNEPSLLEIVKIVPPPTDPQMGGGSVGAPGGTQTTEHIRRDAGPNGDAQAENDLANDLSSGATASQDFNVPMMRQ